ncbi:RNA polymerase I associated factor, A49-like protein [Geopyxis carbonaria]|nr:RNA polymerase I associated factor, A49-like protein [Geopyxis carbonaria]
MSSQNKRKRHAPSTEPITVIHAETSEYPPLIATCRGVTLPNQPYTPYVSTAANDGLSRKKRVRAEYLLHTSNSRLDYEGREVAEENELEKQYIGIYDPATNTVSFHVAPKLQITSSIKAHRQRDAEVQERGSMNTYEQSRVALGKAFGTRKAQLALESREINKVDVSGMDEETSTVLVKQVEENTKDIPTSEMLSQAHADVRQIPAYNKDATKPAEVYQRVAVISEDEWSTIWTSDWVNAGSVATTSLYVNNRVNKLLEDQPKKHTIKLKMLKYISWMLAFYTAQQKNRGRLPPIGKAKTLLYGASQATVEGFYKRFAEDIAGPAVQKEDGTMRESTKYTVSPRLENKLIYHIAVLCLMVDDYDVDIYDLKVDMNITPRELTQAFKEVGCVVKELSKTQYTSMKMTKADAQQHKKAVLKIPLEFPTAPRKRMAQSRR